MKHALSITLLGAALAALAAGCVSMSKSPPARFYALQALAPSGAARPVELSPIGVGPVRVPEYLNRPQIVTQGPDHRLVFAEFDRWGEPLDSALARTVSANLAILLPKAAVVVHPWNQAVPVKIQVTMDIVRLDSRLDGDVRLAAQWSVIETEGRKLLLLKTSEYRRPVEGGSYAGVAAALSGVCAELSAEIAAAVSGAAKKKEGGGG